MFLVHLIGCLKTVLNDVSNLCLFFFFVWKKTVELPLLHQQKCNEFYGLIPSAR